VPRRDRDSRVRARGGGVMGQERERILVIRLPVPPLGGVGGVNEMVAEKGRRSGWQFAVDVYSSDWNETRSEAKMNKQTFSSCVI
jgi:hypothetical protein